MREKYRSSGKCVAFSSERMKGYTQSIRVKVKLKACEERWGSIDCGSTGIH